jgi:hypothetical protein
LEQETTTRREEEEEVGGVGLETRRKRAMPHALRGGNRACFESNLLAGIAVTYRPSGKTEKNGGGGELRPAWNKRRWRVNRHK